MLALESSGLADAVGMRHNTMLWGCNSPVTPGLILETQVRTSRTDACSSGSGGGNPFSSVMCDRIKWISGAILERPVRVASGCYGAVYCRTDEKRSGGCCSKGETQFLCWITGGQNWTVGLSHFLNSEKFTPAVFAKVTKTRADRRVRSDLLDSVDRMVRAASPQADQRSVTRVRIARGRESWFAPTFCMIPKSTTRAVDNGCPPEGEPRQQVR